MTPKVRHYAAEVAAEYAVTVDDLVGSRKLAGSLPVARRALYRRLRDDGHTSGQIGLWLGRDGSTVRAALTRGEP